MTDDNYTPELDDLREAYIRDEQRSEDSRAEWWHKTPQDLRESAGAEFDRALAAHDVEVAKRIAQAIRQNCTPTYEEYMAGGDILIRAVADWIENPPAWVSEVPHA